MASSSPARDNAIYGIFALSLAAGLSRTKTTSRVPSVLSNLACAGFSLLGGLYLTKAIANVQIGITRKLGIRLQSKNSYRRRLGFLERWYVAHSRTGQHTGFSIVLELESPPENATLADIGSILRRVSEKSPWLRVKVKRDGVDGIDSRTSLGADDAERRQKNLQRVMFGAMTCTLRCKIHPTPMMYLS